eukprot:jgi/Bigna1/85074/estExt_fgenesh1_pg.C_20106
MTNHRLPSIVFIGVLCGIVSLFALTFTSTSKPLAMANVASRKAIACRPSRFVSPATSVVSKPFHQGLRRHLVRSESENLDGSQDSGILPEAEAGLREEFSEPEQKCPGCGKIGGPDWGCNGQGNQMGGLALVFPWWPIKVYRPCPEYLAAGGSYNPAGQGVEEILFGSKKTDAGAGQRSRD